MFPSVHILGSRQFGGAEQYYVQLVRALRESNKPVVAVNPAGSPVAKVLRRKGIDQMHLPLAGRFDGWSAWRIDRYVNMLAPCVVQTYMDTATRLTRLGVRHGAVHVARVGPGARIDLCGHADAWVGATKSVCDQLVAAGCPAERVHRIGPLVPDPVWPDEATRHAARERQGIPAETFVLFARGRLAPNRGFSDLLRAFAQVSPELNGRPSLLAIAGEGPLEGSLKRLTTELHLWERVKWLGGEDSKDYFLLSDLYVYPFREDPLAASILDAWSYGLPVVATATLGAKELIEDERSGLLAEPGDPLSLASRLDAAITASRMARVGLSEAGYFIVLQRFGRSAVTTAYLDLYDELLTRRGI